MSKRSFNDIEQIIKTVAESHEPAFNEQDWVKMETMLNREDDRRRPFIFWIWWLIPLVAGIGALGYFMFDNKPGEKQEVVKINNKVQAEQHNNPAGDKEDPVKNPSLINDNSNGSAGVNVVPNNEVSVDKVPVAATTFSGNNNNQPQATNLQSGVDQAASPNPRYKKAKAKMAGKVSASNPVIDESDQMKTGLVNIAGTNKADDKPDASESNDSESDDIIIMVADDKKGTTVQLPPLIDSLNEILKTKDKPKNKMPRFYLVALAGIEGNGVKLFAADKITTRVGLSMGYRLNKRLDIQTGFYSGSKKYVAGANDYKTKPGTYWNVVDMQWIDANCRVYEIPVAVIYNFNPGKKNALFASAGLSSYLMKKENYHMYYEHYGVPREAEVSYTGNKSIFSVLRLAGGIERKISGNFSLLASPGFAIPLGGVGEGEVKLFSVDISIGLKYTPKRKN